MIGLINYGLGNLRSFLNLYQREHIPVKIVSSPSEIKSVDKLILPGVGHFDHAMDLFNGSGLRDCVENQVLDKKVPVLGVCVGMQMLGRSSSEGKLPGLNWICGEVVHFEELIDSHRLPVPHMGWNTITKDNHSLLFENIADNKSRFYFLHSYLFKCDLAESSIARVNYGINFTCGVSRENIYGVQFHPEKSHSAGVALLKNFAEVPNVGT